MPRVWQGCGGGVAGVIGRTRHGAEQRRAAARHTPPHPRHTPPHLAAPRRATGRSTGCESPPLSSTAATPAQIPGMTGIRHRCPGFGAAETAPKGCHGAKRERNPGRGEGSGVKWGLQRSGGAEGRPGVLLGTHAPKLDEKGRVILPAKFRDELSGDL
ncbi:hypothetical protein [Sphingomonas sp. LR61]|uniref:hypothetical protein n=1 Tax=Sphingomonas sp. LR61 TaxID=3050234 RepID=UPI003FA711BE